MPLFSSPIDKLNYMTQRILLILLVISFAWTANSQNSQIGFGFRAGLSYSKFDGPSEMGPNGETLESWSNDKGFHIGGGVTYKFTDLVGARLELSFSQRGTKTSYEGPSYYVLGRGTVSAIKLNGTRHQNLNVNNAYIDFPLTVYYKIGKFEIFGGLNTGILLASTGGGSITFDGVQNGNAVTPFTLTLDHNYKKDEAGGASADRTIIDVNGLTYAEPTRLGAYYEFEERGKMQYQTIDMGLIGGASYYINEGLFFSFRYVYGLGDVDRNDYDISLQTINSNNNIHTHVPRADTNKSLSMQFSVGFSFGQ